MFDTAQAAGFCPKCLTPTKTGDDACPKCASKHIISHKELFDLTIAHVDCDAFYAAIEKRDDPTLADRPVIIGGGVRGVVSTCCYIARTYGVRSAMPMFKALKACPDAVVIKPNMAKYSEAGGQIRSAMRTLTPLVQPISIDEAFLDMSGTDRLHGAPPAVTLAKLQTTISEEIGVSVSIGLSHNKFLAKLASDFDKPNGYFVIGKAEAFDFLGKLPITKIWGIGPAMAKRIERDGLTRIKQLQGMDESVLAKRYGEIGLRMARLSRGEDYRRVSTSSPTKSLSSETTFNEDISDRQTLEDTLWYLCEKVSARMKAKNYTGRVVTLKLKNANFKSITRRRTLTTPTNLARLCFRTAAQLLAAEVDTTAYRLIGVGFSELEPADTAHPCDLFEEDHAHIEAQENAIDEIRAKFGDDAIEAGRRLRGKNR